MREADSEYFYAKQNSKLDNSVDETFFKENFSAISQPTIIYAT